MGVYDQRALQFCKRLLYRAFAIAVACTRLSIRFVLWVLEEFEPWFKWLVLDAVLAYFVGISARHWLRLARFYQAIGWL